MSETKSTEKWSPTECQKCHREYALRDGHEPTEFCDECAHDVIDQLQSQHAQLTAENQALRKERDEWEHKYNDAYATGLMFARSKIGNLRTKYDFGTLNGIIFAAEDNHVQLRKECEGLRENVGMTVQSLRAQLAKAQEAVELPFDDEVRWILGQVCFMCRDYAKMLVASGKYQGKEKAEDEQAIAIHWMLSLYLKHKGQWREEGRKELEFLRTIIEKENER